MALRIYKSQPDDGTLGHRDQPDFLKAVHGLEGGFVEGTKARDIVKDNETHVDELIGEFRPAVFKALGGGDKGELAARLRDSDAETKERELNPSLGRRIARSIFGKIPLVKRFVKQTPSKEFLREQPPLASADAFALHLDEAGKAATNREVLAPVIYDPERVWESKILKDPKILKLLKEHVSEESLQNPETDPVLTYALNFMLEKVRSASVAGAAPGDLDAASALVFLKKALGAADGHHDATEMKTEFDGIKHEYGEIQSTIQKIEQVCGLDTVAAFITAKNDAKIAADTKNAAANIPLDAAKTALGIAQTALDGITDPKTDYVFYETNRKIVESKQKILDRATDDYKKVEEKSTDAKKKADDSLKEIGDLQTKLGHATGEMFKNTKDFNENNHDGDSPILADAELNHFKDLDDKAHAKNTDEAIKLFGDKKIFQKTWKKFEKGGDKVVKATEAHGNHGAEHAHPHVSSTQLLNKIYYSFVTTREKDGGGAENTDAVDNLVFQHKRRSEAAIFAAFGRSDAKDMSVFAANRARAEALAKVLPKSERMKFLPDFDLILQSFRHIATEDQTRPFAKLQLKRDTSRAEIRHMIQHGTLKEDDLPLLIGHIQKVLEGDGTSIAKAEDLPFIMAMIRNLRLVREEMKFNTIIKKPGKFDDKLKELLADDTAIDEVRDTIDEAGLFTMLKDKSFLKGQKGLMMKDVTDRVKAGTLTIADGMKELKENGVDVGRGTWGKLVALRAGGSVVNTWKNVWGRGPFAWLRAAPGNLWGGVKKSNSWFWGTWLGKGISYSFNPFTMKKNYPIIPPIFKGGHGHDDHSGGGGHGGGGH